MIEWKLERRTYVLTLGHPPCNEIGTKMLSGLESFLQEVNPDNADALILCSSLESGFSAGADLRELYEGLVTRPPSSHLPELSRFLDRIHDVMNRLDTLPLTTIGVIHGVCFGGGFELALTCDLRVAESTARFCFPELRLGIIPGFGGIPRLKRDVGNGLVRDLLLTGRSINAKKAQAAGLVSQVVASGEGMNVARAVADQSAKFDRDARVTAKHFIKTLPKAELEIEKEHFLRLFQNQTVRESLQTFVTSSDVRPYLA